MKKSIISPILAVLYVVTAITGIFLFFHIQGGAIKRLHEWLGIAFVIFGILHLVLNWKIFTRYFKKISGAAVIAIAVFLAVAISLWSGFSQNSRYKQYEHGHFSKFHDSSKTYHYSDNQ